MNSRICICFLFVFIVVYLTLYILKPPFVYKTKYGTASKVYDYTSLGVGSFVISIVLITILYFLFFIWKFLKLKIFFIFHMKIPKIKNIFWKYHFQKNEIKNQLPYFFYYTSKSCVFSPHFRNLAYFLHTFEILHTHIFHFELLCPIIKRKSGFSMKKDML